jgi:hypothetical protein
VEYTLQATDDVSRVKYIYLEGIYLFLLYRQLLYANFLEVSGGCSHLRSCLLLRYQLRHGVGGYIRHVNANRLHDR